MHKSRKHELKMSCMFSVLSLPFSSYILPISYQMFEINMDEYLDEEVESVKLSFHVICRDWAEKVVGSRYYSNFVSNVPMYL